MASHPRLLGTLLLVAAAAVADAFAWSGMLFQVPSRHCSTELQTNPRANTAVATLRMAAAKGAKAPAIGGFGKKAATKAPPAADAATLLRQSMELYEKLGYTERADDDEDESPDFRDFIICVRHSGENQVPDLKPACDSGCEA